MERKPFSLNLLFSLSSTGSFAGLGMECVDIRDNIMVCISKHKLLLWILCGRRRLCCSTNRMQVCKKSNMVRKVYGERVRVDDNCWAVGCYEIYTGDNQ